MDSECVRRPLRVNDVPFAAAENRTHTCPCIGRKTCARNRVAQCKRAENRADRMIMIDPSVNKNRNRRILEDIETRLAGVQSKSFDTETSIAAEKILNVASAAPRVIAANVMIVSAKYRIALTGALHDVHQ